MAETILDRTGRLYHFPQHPKLERLLASYDPEIGYFKLTLWRRQARALRRELFGPDRAPQCAGQLRRDNGVRPP
jgi:hypothetical protein